MKSWRHVVPWVVSAALLAYVFGFATDWAALVGAMRHADVPLFLAVTAADRLAFFGVWTWLQALAVRKFVREVSFREVFAIRGGSELLRAVSNPLSDAAFFVGLARLTGGRMDAVLGAALIPGVIHFAVMVLQLTIALPLLPGGLEANPDVALTAGVSWAIVAAAAGAAVLAPRFRLPAGGRVRRFLGRIPPRRLLPYVACFALLAVFDVTIQWLASRAFGVPIPWLSLLARIPILYLALTIPSFANYGTRELAWAGLFADHAPRDTLIAYAFATNTLFLLLNVVIGVLFLPRALELLRTVREARAAGEPVPEPLLHDALEG